ncbi:dehydratase [Actinomadura sp. LD22]|uniref:Dehydratase n=1 Tax=Actinomadura physcomitrii TaxID=2650748 RepID=A0A6I4M6Y0_9ACTN|nr:MaoC family dehydratase [Actinomadura physcomitrii]MVZ99916.1 dehydratase [Actinomadura physcomitrii]
MTAVATGAAGLRELTGKPLGHSDWVLISQERINAFADATSDHQWIHVDVERATRESAFGGAIAHGFLTLSLIPKMLPEILQVTGFRMGVNYGCDKVRFPAPVPAGSRVRGTATLEEVTDVPGGVQLRLAFVIEIENHSKPACVATVLLRRYE